MKGILCIDKPEGLTSSDVVVRVRRILGFKTVGHTGTLDPQGTGILLIGVGKATRLFDFYLKKDKVYEAEFAFGYETDTLDKDGKIIKKTQSLPTLDEILLAMEKHKGKIEQVPPQYSAKSVNGQRAYVLARKGIDFELMPSTVEVFSFDFLKKTAENTYKFRIHCSAGTYIRSICRDLAYSLGSLATMVSIRRTKCGNFIESDAITLEKLEVLKQKALISVETALMGADRIDLPNEYYDKLIKGMKIPYQTNLESFVLYCKNELFGIGCIKDGFLKIKTFLRD